MAVTTRFPGDAADRFRAVPESARWLDRLEIVGIDVRDPRRVLDLCDRLLTAGEPLDILVNHAAQTVRRSAASYAALAGRELAAGPHDDGQVGTTALLPQVDASGLLPDLSPVNSWSARLGELDATETVETQLVNAIAPALLCDRPLPLLLASKHPRRYIVNVSALEGGFEAHAKTSRHPHTNMAKAALNMLTRTSAADLADQGVYMCAVDTGWVTNENPEPKRAPRSGACCSRTTARRRGRRQRQLAGAAGRLAEELLERGEAHEVGERDPAGRDGAGRASA